MRKLLLPVVMSAVACTFAPRTAAAIGDAPNYDSQAMSDMSPQWGFGTPEEDGRPGQYYFIKAVEAVKHKQYRFAVDMYETSASWAYKPAEYNLAVMYLNGEGVPVDKSRAMAWAALAAERNDADYVQAREVIYAALSTDEFAKANEIWRELKKTYGDDVALARAKTRWAQVKAGITGSRVGGVGNLKVGSAGKNVKPVRIDASGRSALDANTFSAFGVLGASSVDGAVAYKQLRESDNPYDPKFERQPAGTATVEPIVPLRDAPPTADDHPHNY
ncbi:MAG TPA: sel1 repeat family protein [Rhodanobacteraceae bacterium]|nr:sel1 repeat family protein [Rhodanobacteraceae bacterium]